VPAITRDAAMRIVAQRGDGPGLAQLMKASLSLPKEQRAGAVQALSQLATLSLVPHFVGLLNDREPNVRIAALNAIGKALGPYTDETIATDAGGAGDKGGSDPELGRHCDLALAKMRELLVRDRIWQVRAAAAENLFALRMRRVIPILIDGLEAELKREKDPWAMDVRLHRLLERITGQKMLLGQVEEWKRFWRDEGHSIRLTASTELAAETKQATATGKRVYEKFFNIEIESDRLLFVIDFSGSMTEVITLKTRGTAAAPGTPMTKAKLVVEELKKIITSLPDGTLFNIIVFSEEVRVWRTQSDGRPSLVRLDDETRDDLLGSYLDALQPAGATNLYGALKTALAFGGRGLFDKYYEAGFDTLYVMSDGAPTWGEVVDTEEILRMVREGNALRRFAIHTVTFGDVNEMRFLQDLAAQNGGRHIHIE
jgi:Mg-chelatase subunit ChlD